jgi:hypothetical protein
MYVMFNVASMFFGGQGDLLLELVVEHQHQGATQTPPHVAQVPLEES